MSSPESVSRLHPEAEPDLRRLLRDSPSPVVTDGAMGTYFHQLTGEPSDQCERWNVTHPDTIFQIHRAYLQAGAVCLRTNTYGWAAAAGRPTPVPATPALAGSGTDWADRDAMGSSDRDAAAAVDPEAAVSSDRDAAAAVDPEAAFRPERIIRQAWQLARSAVAAHVAAGGRPAVILANLGYLPEGIADGGPFDVFRAVDTWLELGATHFICETLTDDRQLAAVASYIRERSPGACLIASFAVQPEGLLMTGEAVSSLFRRLDASGEIDILGLNCVSGPVPMLRLASRIGRLSKPLMVLPNAGYPTVMDREMVFPVQPGYFAEQMRALLNLGVRIAGGCCGTTPDHIRALRGEVDRFEAAAGARPVAAEIAARSAAGAASDPAAAGARPDSAACSGPVASGAELPSLRVAEPKDFSDVCAHPANSFLNKLAVGQRVIAVEYDSPDPAQLSLYLQNARRLEAAGADVLTVADCPVARPRADSSLTAAVLKSVLTHCEPLPHLTCRDRNVNATKALLLGLNMQAIYNVLIVTGDPIPKEDRADIKVVFNFNSVVLSEYIRGLNGTAFEHPMHVSGALDINARNFDAELRRARRKQAAGMMTFFTQPVLSERAAVHLEQARSVLDGAYILGGLMPVISYRNAVYMQNELSGIQIDPDIVERYAGLGRAHAEALALDLTVGFAERIQQAVHGFYVITPFNRVNLVCRILEMIRRL